MRTVLGPKLDKFTIALAAAAIGTAAADPSAPPPKLDPAPTLKGVHTEADPFAVDFDIPAYDLNDHNRLLAITVVVLPVGHGEPATPEDWLASSYSKGLADTVNILTGGEARVEIPDLPDGDFSGQVLFTYDA